MNVREKIKQLRLTLRLNQSQFARKLKLYRSSVCLYEKGDRKPSMSTIRKLIELAEKHGIKKLTYKDFFQEEKK